MFFKLRKLPQEIHLPSVFQTLLFVLLFLLISSATLSCPHHILLILLHRFPALLNLLHQQIHLAFTCRILVLVSIRKICRFLIHSSSTPLLLHQQQQLQHHQQPFLRHIIQHHLPQIIILQLNLRVTLSVADVLLRMSTAQLPRLFRLSIASSPSLPKMKMPHQWASQHQQTPQTLQMLTIKLFH